MADVKDKAAQKDEIEEYYTSRELTPGVPAHPPNYLPEPGLNQKTLFDKQGKLLTLTDEERKKQLLNMKSVNRKAGLNSSLGGAAARQQALMQERLKAGKVIPTGGGTAMAQSINERDTMLQTRMEELKKEVKAAGNRDPLLQATNEVLLDENKRLMEEVRALKEEKEALQVRLDAATDRLFKTVDILQERVVAGKGDESS